MRSKSIECFVKAQKKCPVIAVTAHHDNTVGELALKSGIKEVRLKPVTYDMLEEILRKYY